MKLNQQAAKELWNVRYCRQEWLMQDQKHKNAVKELENSPDDKKLKHNAGIAKDVLWVRGVALSEAWRYFGKSVENLFDDVTDDEMISIANGEDV